MLAPGSMLTHTKLAVTSPICDSWIQKRLEVAPSVKQIGKAVLFGAGREERKISKGLKNLLYKLPPLPPLLGETGTSNMREFKRT